MAAVQFPVFPQLCSITEKYSSCTLSTISLMNMDEYCIQSSLDNNPAAGSAMMTPLAPVAFRAMQ